jgi:hypothetical protein
MDGVYVGCQDARFVRRATKCAWLIATPTAPGLIATARASSPRQPRESPTKIVATICSKLAVQYQRAADTRWHHQRRLRRAAAPLQKGLRLNSAAP